LRRPARGRRLPGGLEGTRGYVIQLRLGREQLFETYDWDWFEAFVKTLDLH
jgi:hypothetical protein